MLCGWRGAHPIKRSLATRVVVPLKRGCTCVMQHLPVTADPTITAHSIVVHPAKVRLSLQRGYVLKRQSCVLPAPAVATTAVVPKKFVRILRGRISYRQRASN